VIQALAVTKYELVKVFGHAQICSFSVDPLKTLKETVNQWTTVKVYNAWCHNDTLATRVSNDGDPDIDVVILKCWSYPMFESDEHGDDLNRELRKELLSLNLIPEIRDEVDSFNLPSPSIGVHIRRADKVESFVHCKDENFMAIMQGVVARRPDVNFFLATDVKETEIRFRKMFGDRLVTYPKAWRPREEERGVHEGMIDLHLLSRTHVIIGTQDSSFSQTAGRFRGINVIKADEQTATVNLDMTCDFLANDLQK